MPIPEYIQSRIKDNKPEMSVLDLSEHGLADDDIKELMILLLQNLYITNLDLNRNNITSKGIIHFEYLSETAITRVHFGQNRLDDECVNLLMRYFTSVTDLDISYNSFTNASAEILAAQSPQVFLNIVGNQFDREHYLAIDDRIERNRQLSTPLLLPS